MAPTHIICCAEIGDPQWRWIEGTLDDPAVRFEFVRCAPRYAFEHNRRLNLARIRGAWQAVRAARRNNAALLVTHGPTLAAWCTLFARMLGVRARILAFSFNFTTLPSPLKRRIFSLCLAAADRFVVYSTMERELYARAFGLASGRFDVLLWGVQTPEASTPQVPLQQGDYVCAIGGNARDYRTLVRAAQLLPDIRFVVVARPENLRDQALPGNLSVLTDIPFGAAMNVLLHARFMVLPLAGSEVPCGHVTLVAAMHLGKAFIVTASSGVSDYAREGLNCLLVEPGSAGSLVTAIQRLWNDQSLCAKLGADGRAFAQAHCSDGNAVQYVRQYLQSIANAP